MTNPEEKAHRWFCMTMEAVIPFVDDQGDLQILSDPLDEKGVGECFGCFDCEARLTKETLEQACVPTPVESPTPSG